VVTVPDIGAEEVVSNHRGWRECTALCESPFFLMMRNSKLLVDNLSQILSDMDSSAVYGERTELLLCCSNWKLKISYVKGCKISPYLDFLHSSI